MKTLVADDDPTTRRMLRAVLAKWGYDVIEARNGVEAWDHFCGPSPAPLAIIDWIMPGMTGLDLCRRLKSRERGPSPYLILLTARTHWQDVVSGLEAGADDYVAKPYQVEELRARLAVGCRMLSLHRDLMDLNADLERRVRDRTDRIRTLLRRNQELVVQLGHDLRTPLTPLVALLPMLAADEPEGDRRDALRLCIHQTQYLRKLAERVFDLGRLESPRTALALRSLRLRTVADAAIESAQRTHREHAGSTSIDIPSAMEVRADATWLRRVFEDILDNAFRFNPRGTEVAVTAASRENDALVTVADRGCGLERDQIEHLFDPFYTGDISRHDRNKSGLGLAICRRVVERHGGRIWAESPGPGLGTSIRFTVPLADAPYPSTPESDFP